MDDLLHTTAALVAQSVMQALALYAESERPFRLKLGLDAVDPALYGIVAARFQEGLICGAAHGQALASAVSFTLAEHLVSEVGRILGGFESVPAALGLAGPPPVTQVTEHDDVVRHNEPPNRRKKDAAKKWTAWQERLYRGIWWPGFQTAIVDLTPDDVNVASAFLAGKLTVKGCPRSDAAEHEMERKNLGYRIVHGIEMIAGIVATVVMTAFFGAIGGTVTKFLHKAKMAAIDHFWKKKVVSDPVFKAAVEKLKPNAKYVYRGFPFWLRPYGNMLVQELGCKADLRTRLLLHGRMLRVLDVLAACSPTAQSGPGLYDYPSSFGMLKGSIFPPRGPAFDGTPPPPKVIAHAQMILKAPAVAQLLHRPTLSLTSTANLITGGDAAIAPAVLRSAHIVRAEIEKQHAAKVASAPGDPQRASHWPLLLLGGAALSAVLLATRSH